MNLILGYLLGHLSLFKKGKVFIIYIIINNKYDIYKIELNNLYAKFF
jgi:hypothetical protein